MCDPIDFLLQSSGLSLRARSDNPFLPQESHLFASGNGGARTVLPPPGDPFEPALSVRGERAATSNAFGDDTQSVMLTVQGYMMFDFCGVVRCI